jgi:tetratricopeptide (TPR) repeat protein
MDKEFPLQELLEQYPKTIGGICGFFVLVVLALLFGAWLLWGSWPRRRRAMSAARKLLDAGKWQDALEQLKITREIGTPSSSWLKAFDEFEAECIKHAAKAAIKEKDFEGALEYQMRAAKILDESEIDVRIGIQSAMLQEIRRLFSKHGETEAVADLVGRALLIQSPCREASFWQAMCDLRGGAFEKALLNLQVARTGKPGSFGLDDGLGEASEPAAAPAPPSPFIDPPLYLGAILLRTGQAKESLRFLTEANRMDANCPFITLQLGAAIVTAGGDTNMAVRALQRALGPKGLGQWLDNADRAWVEGMPENRSYIRKLASEFPFICPLFGEDLKYIIRQGNLALAQGHFKLGNYQDAAEQFDKVLKEGAPSLPVLRGLGLSLARLGKFDDAFVHLRTAHEMEEEKDRLTAGFLALCGACGKPPRAEDRLPNIAWAMRLVTQFNAPGDSEWINLLNRIFAEARKHGVSISRDDQLYLCEHLVSSKCCDPVSAQAFHYLMATEPALIQTEYAWLYCRADEQHKVGGERMLELYALTFSNADAARAYYAERGWNLDDIELMFLQRAAEAAPGRFPEVLGADYLPRGEHLLLAKAQALEEAGQREKALATIEVLVKLSPQNTSAMDRAAMLHFRAGRLQPAYQLLEQWQHAQPHEPLPLVRQALLLYQQNDLPSCHGKLQHAMSLAEGRRRGNIAFLGARLALQQYFLPKPDQPADSEALARAKQFMLDCLSSHPGHPTAQWCLAAIRWLEGDTTALASQADDMRVSDIVDPRYHYLSALCHLIGGKLHDAVAACDRVAAHVGRNGTTAQRALAAEAGYLAALAHVGLNQPKPAIDCIKPVTFSNASPTLSLAQAILGEVLFQEKRHGEAIAAWQSLDAQKREAWGLTAPLATTMFINALESMLRGDYEQAADKLRNAGKTGYRDRRIGPLLLLTLFKAGQKAIYAGETAPVTTSAEKLEPPVSQPASSELAAAAPEVAS